MAQRFDDFPGYFGYPVDCGGVFLGDKSGKDLPLARSVWELLNGVKLDQGEGFFINRDIYHFKSEFTKGLINFLKGVLEFIRLNKMFIRLG